MGNMALTAWPNVQIETSKSNLRKVSALFWTIQSGELGAVRIRPPMRVGDIVKIIGVSRKTFYEWKDGTSMPQPGNLRSIATNLLRVQETDLANYFAGIITLKDLLAIRPKTTTPDDVVNTFQSLGSDREKDAVLALLLNDRAKNLGNVIRKTRRNHVSSQKTKNQGEDIDVASNLGEGLSPKAAGRLKNLLNMSRAKHSRIAGRELEFYEILERNGIDPNPFVEIIDAASMGQISELYGPRLFREDWEVFAVICFQPDRWDLTQPTALYDHTFRDRPQLLKRSLMENGEPHPVGR